jgi:hypothetical protein
MTEDDKENSREFCTDLAAQLAAHPRVDQGGLIDHPGVTLFMIDDLEVASELAEAVDIGLPEGGDVDIEGYSSTSTYCYDYGDLIILPSAQNDELIGMAVIYEHNSRDLWPIASDLAERINKHLLRGSPEGDLLSARAEGGPGETVGEIAARLKRLGQGQSEGKRGNN